MYSDSIPAYFDKVFQKYSDEYSDVFYTYSKGIWNWNTEVGIHVEYDEIQCGFVALHEIRISHRIRTECIQIHQNTHPNTPIHNTSKYIQIPIKHHRNLWNTHQIHSQIRRAVSDTEYQSEISEYVSNTSKYDVTLVNYKANTRQIQGKYRRNVCKIRM